MRIGALGPVSSSEVVSIPMVLLTWNKSLYTRVAVLHLSPKNSPAVHPPLQWTSSPSTTCKTYLHLDVHSYATTPSSTPLFTPPTTPSPTLCTSSAPQTTPPHSRAVKNIKEDSAECRTSSIL